MLIGSLAGFALYTWLLRATTITVASAYAYVVPIVAYLCAVLALAEPFHPAVLPGAAAIIAALALRPAPAPDQPQHPAPAIWHARASPGPF